MILSDSAIKAAMKAGSIVIEPFEKSALGGNSYDVHLGPWLMTYNLHPDGSYTPLDCKQEPTCNEIEMNPDTGYLLTPGTLYLASTLEYTETNDHVPYLDGKSSIGRLGISIHVTAGRGDVGFKGHWTMEITAIHPVRVYPNMPIGQLTYHTVNGPVQARYDQKDSGKYRDGRDPKPQASRMWRNFQH